MKRDGLLKEVVGLVGAAAVRVAMRAHRVRSENCMVIDDCGGDKSGEILFRLEVIRHGKAVHHEWDSLHFISFSPAFRRSLC